MAMSKFCMNCAYYEKGKCEYFDKRVNGNVKTNCDAFNGEEVFVDWSKAHTIGYRPSTFTENRK